MKAIVNVSKSSAYSIYNGLTFDVVEVTDVRISLVGVSVDFPDNMVDFTLNEVIIVDIKEELLSEPLLRHYVESNGILIH